MRIGKFILGGICAAGAVVAAPAVLMTAGLAVAATPLGLGAGAAVMGISTEAAAATAGIVGTTVGSELEKRKDTSKAYQKGKESGYNAASDEYSKKMDNLKESFEKTQRETDERFNRIINS